MTQLPWLKPKYYSLLLMTAVAVSVFVVFLSYNFSKQKTRLNTFSVRVDSEENTALGNSDLDASQKNLKLFAAYKDGLTSLPNNFEVSDLLINIPVEEAPSLSDQERYALVGIFKNGNKSTAVINDQVVQVGGKLSTGEDLIFLDTNSVLLKMQDGSTKKIYFSRM